MAAKKKAITWTNERRKLSDLIPWERNPRTIKNAQAERLVDSVETFGQVETLAVDCSNNILNGHQRYSVLAGQYGMDYEVDVRVASRELSERERQQLTVYLHRGSTGEWNFDDLANNFEIDDLLTWGFTEAELGLTFDDNLTSDDSEITTSNTDNTIDRADVPDALWPSDNDWGVPLLDINLQATALDQPWAIWGSIERKSKMNGTWLFYTEDYRYEALWADPSPLLNTGCISAVEPNFSCYENMPAAVALWQIYRKRWIARWWQGYGVRVFADLNVASNHYDLNMLGIPQGWKAFATRGYMERIDDTHREYEQARRIAGDGVTPLFVVYGGNKDVKAECQRNGWIWLKENMDSGKGREV